MSTEIEIHTFRAMLVMQALATYGEREVAGTKRSSFVGQLIDRWFRKDADDSKTAWCAIWLAEMVERCGHAPPALPYRAKSWATWGREVMQAQCGSIVVLRRPDGGYHVTIAIRYTDDGRILCLGGNQANSVNIATYPVSAIYAIRELT